MSIVRFFWFSSTCPAFINFSPLLLRGHLTESIARLFGEPVLAVKVLLVFFQIPPVKLLPIHPHFEAHAGEEMEDVNQLSFYRLLVNGLGVLPPFIVDLVDELGD